MYNTRMPTLYTIGHSRHPVEHFLHLLQRHHIEAVADIRSHPVSRFAPQFNKKALAEALGAHGIRYVFLGKELGGRPPGDEMYDAAGYVLYGNVAASPLFQEGVRRLREGMAQYRTAVLCSEENPTGCHRRLLVGRVLGQEGVQIVHIRGDGALAEEGEVQPSLFNAEDDWKSVKPVKAPRS
jgi:uncharacterized protein (DUF488 family)